MYFHVWFVSKCRRPVIEGIVCSVLKKAFTECIRRHSFNVPAIGMGRDHVHMLINADNKCELVGIVRVLKTISAREALMLLRFEGLNNGHFWARRYGFRELSDHELSFIVSYINDHKFSNFTGSIKSPLVPP